MALLTAAALACAGCGSPSAGTTPSPTPPAGRLKVLATFTVLADMTARIGGDRVQAESLTRPGAEIHGYEPTTSDLRRASQADLILSNGLGLENWLGRFVRSSSAPQVAVTDGITPLPTTPGSAVPNPHAWMSPALGERYVDNIVAALGRQRPGDAPVFRSRGEQYKEELRAIGRELKTAVSTLPAGQRTLVSCEGAFSYLAREIGMQELFLWPVNNEGEATAQQIAHVTGTVRQRRIPAVFCESTVPDKVMRQVASSTGASFGGSLYVDSLSEAGGPVPSYLELLRHDARTITAALARRAGS